jgi:dTDP-4-dehydrorhamnose reductase
MSKSRVVVTGRGGQLGRQLGETFRDAGWDVLGSTHDELDIADREAVRGLAAWTPDVVINAAAWTDVDGCARDPERAMRINGEAAGWVAEAAARAGAFVVQVSTNEVFGGTRDVPYREDDEPHPINPYGASKLLGEELVATANPRHLIVRTAWIFGPGARNFPSRIMEVARKQVEAAQPLRVVADEFGNPTWAPDLAQDILRAVLAVLDGTISPGILHIAGEPPTSRFAWAQAILTGITGVQLVPISAEEYPRPSRVPPRAVLATDRARELGITPSDWRGATAAYAKELLAVVAT